MYRDSVWYPNTRRSIIVIGLLVVMTVLHFTEVVGLMDAGLLFGWLPIQLVYDVGFTLVSVVLLYWVYTMAPDVPASFEGTSESGNGPSAAEDSDTEGGA